MKKTWIGSLMIMSLIVMIGTSCKKDDDNPPSSTVTDVDGNVYNTVVIGTQTWMASNLKTTKYNDGVAIPLVTDAIQWSIRTTGAYCDYGNTQSNSNTYGRLYNWHAINTGKLCPPGWHVPSEAEWATLINYLGDPATAGGKLKESGTNHWLSPNEAATNSTGFTGLPGGFRDGAGDFLSIATNGFWWSSSIGTDPANAWFYILGYNIGTVANFDDLQTSGLSVRCIKD